MMEEVEDTYRQMRGQWMREIDRRDEIMHHQMLLMVEDACHGSNKSSPLKPNQPNHPRDPSC